MRESLWCGKNVLIDTTMNSLAILVSTQSLMRFSLKTPQPSERGDQELSKTFSGL